jgi:hypothetical protein
MFHTMMPCHLLHFPRNDSINSKFTWLSNQLSGLSPIICSGNFFFAPSNFEIGWLENAIDDVRLNNYNMIEREKRQTKHTYGLRLRGTAAAAAI